jgi:dCTP deaminase
MSVNISLEPADQPVEEDNKRDDLHNTGLSSFLSEVSLLSDRDIELLIKSELLRIEPFIPGSLNPSSIDLRLGSVLTKYYPQEITLGQCNPDTSEIDIIGSNYRLKPGEFILGTTQEKVSIPDGYQGVIETKGNVARAGVQVHSNDGHIDPGFCGHITLEIVNLHKTDVSINLVPGTPICQLFIGKLTSYCKATYNGKYMNQVKPTAYFP